MGLTEDIGKLVREAITKSPRHLAVFIFLVFVLGEVVGIVVSQRHPGLVDLALLLPVGLAILSFYSNTFAVLAFVVFVVLILLI